MQLFFVISGFFFISSSLVFADHPDFSKNYLVKELFPKEEHFESTKDFKSSASWNFISVTPTDTESARVLKYIFAKHAQEDVIEAHAEYKVTDQSNNLNAFFTYQDIEEESLELSVHVQEVTKTRENLKVFFIGWGQKPIKMKSARLKTHIFLGQVDDEKNKEAAQIINPGWAVKRGKAQIIGNYYYINNERFPKSLQLSLEIQANEKLLLNLNYQNWKSESCALKEEIELGLELTPSEYVTFSYDYDFQDKEFEINLQFAVGVSSSKKLINRDHTVKTRSYLKCIK